MKSQSVTIQMKATEQYFPVLLFVFCYFAERNFNIFSGRGMKCQIVSQSICVGFVLAYLLNRNSCILLVLFFRKDIFTTIKAEQEEKKDQKRVKSIEVKQTEKDKISFVYKNDAFERWWQCMSKPI